MEPPRVGQVTRPKSSLTKMEAVAVAQRKENKGHDQRKCVAANCVD